jgi:hypothetical protein
VEEDPLFWDQIINEIYQLSDILRDGQYAELCQRQIINFAFVPNAIPDSEDALQRIERYKKRHQPD